MFQINDFIKNFEDKIKNHNLLVKKMIENPYETYINFKQDTVFCHQKVKLKIKYIYRKNISCKVFSGEAYSYFTIFG